METKSTVEEIRKRFDDDVERFSNLQTGQSAAIDAPLVMELVTQAAAATNPDATRALDVGCGGGNYTLKLLQVLPDLEVDLSRPMLDRAVERVGALAERYASWMSGSVGPRYFGFITGGTAAARVSVTNWRTIRGGIDRTWNAMRDALA